MKNFKVIGFLCLSIFLAGGAGARGPWELTHSAEKHSRSVSSAEALELYSPQQRLDSFDACLDQFPGRLPLKSSNAAPTMRVMALCSDGFAVLYSQTSKTPLVVVERLTASTVREAKGEARTDNFYADPRIPKDGRAELSDFRSQNPPVDRGHQFPAADSTSPSAMKQSFALSNMVGQNPENNRKSWNKIESDVRKFALRAKGNVFVFTGPLFEGVPETLGENKVWKPKRLFKLVYDEASGRAWAYIMPNTADAQIQPPMDYPEFVKQTGLNLLSAVKPRNR